MSVVCVMVLSAIFCFGINTALEQWKAVPPLYTSGVQLGGKGLMLSNGLTKNETAVVLLEGTENPLGPRVVAIPGQPLVYQQAAGGNFELPPVQFGDDTPWFLKSIAIDIKLNSEMFRQKFQEGILSYLFYAGSLIFLLCSLAYAVKFSVWPLANLFLASLVFRGVLSFNTFFTSPSMMEIIDSFLNNLIPLSAALPLFFLLTGGLVNLYSLLSYAAKRRHDDDN